MKLGLGRKSLKTYYKIISLISLGVCVTYFILRFVYEVIHVKVINTTTSVISLVAGIVLFVIGLKLFFHDKNKKDSIQPIVISTILILINVIDYLL
jgi:predicted tellurium resistance membrane protein TerC